MSAGQGWPLLPGDTQPPSGDHGSLQSTVVSHQSTVKCVSVLQEWVSEVSSR